MKEHSNYCLVNVSEHFDDLKKVASSGNELFDKIAWQKFFHQLPKDQLEVFILEYMGFSPKEIKKTLRFKKIAHVYYLNVKTKRLFRKNLKLLN